jgi:hypothetical protein
VKIVTRAFILFIGLSIVFGCGPTKKNERRANPIESFAAPTNVVVNVSPDINKYNIKRIAILPFGYKRFARIKSVDRDANLMITRMFTRQLSMNTKLQIVSREEINELMSSRNVDSFNRETFPNGISLLRNKGIDGAVMGQVSRYTERTGNALSVREPASVAFEIYLLNVQNGAVIWSAAFDRTQKALSENVLAVGSFLKGGGTWQTGETLARLGIEEVVKRFPQSKTAKQESEN